MGLTAVPILMEVLGVKSGDGESVERGSVVMAMSCHGLHVAFGVNVFDTAEEDAGKYFGILEKSKYVEVV